jgi:hypothetical protein
MMEARLAGGMRGGMMGEVDRIALYHATINPALHNMPDMPGKFIVSQVYRISGIRASNRHMGKIYEGATYRPTANTYPVFMAF